MAEAVVEKGSNKLRTKRLKEMKAGLLLNEERDLGGADETCTPMKPSKRKNTAASLPDIDREADFRAESGEDLRGTFTKFTFKPRERMTRADQSVASAQVAVQDGARLTAPQMPEKQAGRSSSLPPAEGGRAHKTLRLGTHKHVSSEVLNAAQKETLEDTEHLLPTRSPGEKNGNPNKHPQSAPKTDHPKAKVASSTLTKLSRFSFMGSAEEKPGGKTPPQVAINKVPRSTVSEDQEETSTDAKTATPQTVNARTGPSDRQEEFRENGAKKRRCFESSSAGLLRGFSLFSSSVFEDEDLDADWN